MIGCVLLGAAGLFLAAKAFHFRRYGCGGHGRWGHHGHHFGPGAGGGWEGTEPWEPGGGGGFGRGFVLRGIAERLDASPAQERVIRDAADELHEAAHKLRGEARRTRADVADAFRKPHFDEVLFGELFARHDRSLEELRKAFVGAGAKVHDALDERQRARLADLIESGPGGGGGGGGAGGGWGGRGGWGRRW
jgi:hypothetical protein